MKPGFTYILTNKTHTVLYVGVTSNLPQRILEHKAKKYQNSFSAVIIWINSFIGNRFRKLEMRSCVKNKLRVVQDKKNWT